MLFRRFWDYKRHQQKLYYKASLEAIAYQILMQFQADIAGANVVRPKVVETTALGAPYLAGFAVGYWKDKKELQEAWRIDKVFVPLMGSIYSVLPVKTKGIISKYLNIIHLNPLKKSEKYYNIKLRYNINLKFNIYLNIYIKSS